MVSDSSRAGLQSTQLPQVPTLTLIAQRVTPATHRRKARRRLGQRASTGGSVSLGRGLCRVNGGGSGHGRGLAGAEEDDGDAPDKNSLRRLYSFYSYLLG
jgi:peptidoglycan hydrolase-like amidase